MLVWTWGIALKCVCDMFIDSKKETMGEVKKRGVWGEA